jgi:hypothetical protein
MDLRFRTFHALHDEAPGIYVRLGQARWQEPGSEPAYLGIELGWHAKDGEDVVAGEQADRKTTALARGVCDGDGPMLSNQLVL